MHIKRTITTLSKESINESIVIYVYLHVAAGKVSMDKCRFSAAERAHNAQPDTVASFQKI